jgi:hypothetical protein
MKASIQLSLKGLVAKRTDWRKTASRKVTLILTPTLRGKLRKFSELAVSEIIEKKWQERN